MDPDDFGDFTSFSNENSNATNGEGSGESMSFTLDPFQGIHASNGFQDFPDFSQFGGVEGNLHTAGGVQYEIPPLPPLSPTMENLHMAGGVPFEIPPLPDFDDVELKAIMATPVTLNEACPTATGGTGISIPPPTNGTKSASGGHTTSGTTAASTTESGTGNALPHLQSAGEKAPVCVNTPTESATKSEKFGDFSGSVYTSGKDSNSKKEGSTSFSSCNTLTTNVSPLELGGGSDDFGEFGGFSSNPVTVSAPFKDEGSNGLPSSANIKPLETSSDPPSTFASFASATGDGVFASNSGGGDFGAFTSHGDATGSSDFGAFTSNSDTTGGSDFGAFTANSGTEITSNSDTTGASDFGAFTSNSGTAITSDSTGGSDFGAFTSNSGTTAGGDFGAFTSNSNTTVGTSSSSSSDRTGGTLSSDTTRDTSNSDTTGGTSSSGTTGGTSNSDTTGGTSSSGKPGSSTSAIAGDDEFGAFSSTSVDEFGVFSFSSSVVPQTTAAESDEFGSFSSISSTSTALTVEKIAQSAASTLGTCFARHAAQDTPPPPLPPLTSLLPKCTPEKEQGNSVGGIRQKLSVWVALQNSTDLTVPLHKFDKSQVQSCYYTSLAVDPMLISRPSTLSILTGMTSLEGPLLGGAGATAMEDLRESFGFEGDPRQPGSPAGNVSSPFRRKLSEEQGAALLDLNFPLSPNSPTRDSFTLAPDLAGLDLNPELQHEKKLTSIEELLLNERLVVNRSTWMDSQLADLGGGASTEIEEDSLASQSSTPHMAKKQHSMESQLEQLGLDVSKTTSVKVGSRELSLTARSVLGRLPDLSFMMLRGEMEKRTLYFSGHS